MSSKVCRADCAVIATKGNSYYVEFHDWIFIYALMMGYSFVQ